MHSDIIHIRKGPLNLSGRCFLISLQTYVQMIYKVIKGYFGVTVFSFKWLLQDCVVLSALTRGDELGVKTAADPKGLTFCQSTPSPSGPIEIPPICHVFPQAQEKSCVAHCSLLSSPAQYLLYTRIYYIDDPFYVRFYDTLA